MCVSDCKDVISAEVSLDALFQLDGFDRGSNCEMCSSIYRREHNIVVLGAGKSISLLQ